MFFRLTAKFTILETGKISSLLYSKLSGGQNCGMVRGVTASQPTGYRISGAGVAAVDGHPRRTMFSSDESRPDNMQHVVARDRVLA